MYTRLLIATLLSFSSITAVQAENTALYDAKDIIFKTENNRERAYVGDKLFDGAVILPDEEGRRISYIYRQGQKNGIAVGKYANDKIEIEITYLNGKKNGEMVKFYPNGNAELKETYKDDVLHGERIAFYENGKPQQQSFYENGKLDGTVTYFDKEGNIERIENYKNGIKNGVERIIANNILREENNYVDGKKEGVSKKYNEKFLEEEILYKNDKQEGIHKIYAEDGSWQETPYVNGEKNGIGTVFYPNKSVAQKITYLHNQKNGTAKSFHLNGKLMKTERYKDDQLNGIARYFDDKEDLQYVRYFIDGTKLAEVNLLAANQLHDLYYDAFKKGKLAHFSNKKNLWYKILWLGLNTNNTDILEILKKDMDMYAAPLGDEDVYQEIGRNNFTKDNKELFFGMSPLSYAINLSADSNILQNFTSSINSLNERGTTALQEAVVLDDLQSVKYVLLNGADVTMLNSKGETILIDALNNNVQLPIIAALMQSGVDVNSKDTLGNSPLMIAIKQKNKELMHMLIQNGADLNEITPNGQTLLAYAYTHESPSSILQILLNAHPDINHQDKQGNTVLLSAVKKHDTELVEQLIQQKANVHLANNKDISPLSYVLVHDDIPALIRHQIILAGIDTHDNIPALQKTLWKVLLEQNDLEHLKAAWETYDDITIADVNGERPFYTAVQNLENEALLNLALSFVTKADAEILWTAVQSKDLNFLQQVIAKKAPINEKNDDGETVLTYMIKNNYSMPYIQAVETPETDINAVNKSSEDALGLAIKKNDNALVKNLLEHGANPNRIIDGRNYLMTVKADQPEITNLLLTHNADVMLSEASGKNMLMTAVSNLNSVLFDALIERGYRVDTRDNEGNSALLYLAESLVNYPQMEEQSLKDKWTHIIDTLVKKGENINVQNGAGETLLMRIALLTPEKYETYSSFLVNKGISPDLQNQYGKKAADLLK